MKKALNFLEEIIKPFLNYWTFIKDRRKARKLYESKYPEKVRIRQYTRNWYPKRQLCSVQDCNEIGERHHPDYKQPKLIEWLCLAHHRRKHAKYLPVCSIIDCFNKHHSKGYCAKHNSRRVRGTL